MGLGGGGINVFSYADLEDEGTRTLAQVYLLSLRVLELNA